MQACAAGRAASTAKLIARADVAGSSAMQSTGHGGRHKPQPVQWSATTACRNCGAPAMASTGHASKHRPQPTHASASMRATLATGVGTPAGSTPRASSAFNSATVSGPPGAHRSVRAPSATAAA